jgi:hypothetical protein
VRFALILVKTIALSISSNSYTAAQLRGAPE